MDAHNEYSQGNCLFECMLRDVQDRENLNCHPWYFPPMHENQTMCDPMQAAKFELKYNRKCAKCYPDCNGTSYSVSISQASFRRCDYRNINETRLCTLTDRVEPKIFHGLLSREYDEIPNYAGAIAKENNMRTLMTNLPVFPSSKKNYHYDAYEKDIAVAHFYFAESTLVQFERRLKYTFLDFFAQVGGLLGLCIGFSMCSLIEIFYWFTYKIFTYARNKQREMSTEREETKKTTEL